MSQGVVHRGRPAEVEPAAGRQLPLAAQLGRLPDQERHATTGAEHLPLHGGSGLADQGKLARGGTGSRASSSCCRPTDDEVNARLLALLSGMAEVSPRPGTTRAGSRAT